MDTIGYLLILVTFAVLYRQSQRIAVLERMVLSRDPASAAEIASAMTTPPDEAEPSSSGEPPQEPLVSGWARIASPQEDAAEEARLAHVPPPAPFPGPTPPTESGFEAGRRAYEALLGTRVSVWLGALLLAFGGVFLVKYSLEQGVLGPVARVLMGLLFGAGLLAAGEFLRRRDPIDAVTPGEPNIPALLTGVGALSVFGTVYAAHGLYGFIGPAMALILLGIVGVATMALSLLHGPALAGLGLVGALVVPLLVTSRHPDPWSIALYVPIVAGAAHAFAWEKAWQRLALGASGGVLLWTILLLPSDPDRAATAALGLIGVALGLWSFFVRPGVPQADAGIRLQERGFVASQIGLVLVALAFASGTMNLWFWIAFASATVALPLAVSRLRPDLRRWGCASMVAVTVLTLVWPTPGFRLLAAWGTFYDATHALWSVAAAMIVALLSWEDVRSARDLAPRWGRIVAFNLALAPPVVLLILFVRLTGGTTSWWAGFGAAAAACAYLPVLRDLDRRLASSPDADHGLITGAVLAAILACVALAAFFLFRGVGLTVVFALLTAGTARIAVAYRAPVLRWAVPVFAALTILRIALDPLLVGYGLGTTPIVNGLLVIYGIPALAFAYAGYVLGGPEDVEDLPVVLMQSFALLITAAFVGLEIRHLTHGGRLIDAGYGFVEAGLDAAAMAAGTILLFRLAAQSAGQSYRLAAQGLGWVALAIAGVGLGFALNPVLAEGYVNGTVLFNDLLAGYALPAVMLLALVRTLSRHPEPDLLLGTRMVALWLAFLTVSLWIRFAFLGPRLGIRYGASQAELYTYSAVWLALGIAFLAYGLRFASWPARAAGFLLLFGTAGKVFLADMAGLSGFYRAASFIGLGGVLILVGLFYQRVVVPRMASSGDPS